MQEEEILLEIKSRSESRVYVCKWPQTHLAHTVHQICGYACAWKLFLCVYCGLIHEFCYSLVILTRTLQVWSWENKYTVVYGLYAIVMEPRFEKNKSDICQIWPENNRRVNRASLVSGRLLVIFFTLGSARDNIFGYAYSRPLDGSIVNVWYSVHRQQQPPIATTSCFSTAGRFCVHVFLLD